MKKRVRNKLLVALLLVMTFMLNVFQSTAIAADADETEVRTVKLQVTNRDGKIKFESREKDKYTVITPEKQYSIGETEILTTIEVQPQTGYYFRDDMRISHISLSGTDNGIKRQEVWYNGRNLIIEFEIKVARGKLSAPENAWWDEDDFAIAHWDEVDIEGVSGYEITINGNTERTTRTRANLRRHVVWGKKNTFKVKAISSISGLSDSTYTTSEKLDLTEDSWWWDEYHDYYYDEDHYNNGYYDRPYPSYNWGGWHNGSYYLNGSICRNQWILDRSIYYYVNGEGKIVTGWQNIANKWYYFNSNGEMLHDTSVNGVYGQPYQLLSSGEMRTNYWGRTHKGWYWVNESEAVRGGQFLINGSYYRFNNEGYMITGWWQDISTGYWYYYNSTPDGNEGKLLTNTSAYIDGRNYWFDSNGVAH